MEDIKLPVIKKATPPAKHLSMDKYLKFVFLNLKYVSRKKAREKSKKTVTAAKAFSL